MKNQFSKGLAFRVNCQSDTAIVDPIRAKSGDILIRKGGECSFNERLHRRWTFSSYVTVKFVPKAACRSELECTIGFAHRTKSSAQTARGKWNPFPTNLERPIRFRIHHFPDHLRLPREAKMLHVNPTQTKNHSQNCYQILPVSNIMLESDFFRSSVHFKNENS